jgi:putative transposase
MAPETTNPKQIRRTETVRYDDPWRIPDVLWRKIQPLLPPGKPRRQGGHNSPVEPRRVMDAIFFVVRTGCPWRALNVTGICSSSTAHRWFQVWSRAGVFVQLCRMGLLEHDQHKGIGWRWPSGGDAATKTAAGGKRKQTRPRRSVRTRPPRQLVDQDPSRPERRGARRHRSTQQSAGAGDVGQRADRLSPAPPEEAATPVPGPGLPCQRSVQDVGRRHPCPAPGASGAGEQTPSASPGLPQDSREQPPGAESWAADSHPWAEKARELLRVASSALRPRGLLRRWPAGTDSVLATMRTLTVTMAVCILALLGLTISHWRHRNPQVQQILDRPTAIEQFAQAGHLGRRDNSGDSAPLIVQARALALHLNPPVDAQAVTAAPRPLRSAPPVPPPAAFQLCGTSCYPAQPERSMALIWERGANGGTRRWVREGTQLGRFTVHEIRPGSILCRDGSRISEIVVERETARSLVQSHTASVVRADPTLPDSRPEVRSDAVAK